MKDHILNKTMNELYFYFMSIQTISSINYEHVDKFG